MIRRLKVWGVVLGLAVAGGALAQEKLWVRSSNAKVVAEPAATAKTVAAVPVGSELAVLDSNDRWYRVRTSAGETGWIYRGKVGTSPPDTGGGGLFGAFGSSNIEVSAADTSRSIRGLSPAAEEYASAAKTPVEYKRAVDGVMALRTTAADVDRFLREGRIGEYAE